MNKKEFEDLKNNLPKLSNEDRSLAGWDKIIRGDKNQSLNRLRVQWYSKRCLFKSWT